MEKIVLILTVSIVATLFALVLAYPFMLIWNYTIVSSLTIAKPIGYWVAFWWVLIFSLLETKIKCQ